MIFEDGLNDLLLEVSGDGDLLADVLVLNVAGIPLFGHVLCFSSQLELIHLLCSDWLIGLNTSDYMDSTTVTNLQSSTSSLDKVFYPSVTVCNTNQIR